MVDGESSGSFFEPERSIVLLGLKHSGKSSVAASLSRRTGMPWEDTDRLICVASGCKSAREVYKTFGKGGFKEFEYQVCFSLSKRLEKERIIVATGGGIADNENALECLGTRADYIYLCESRDVLYNRLMKRGRPAFLPESKTEEAWAWIYKRRHGYYQSLAEFSIDCRDRSVEEIAMEVEKLLLSEGKS